MTPEQLKQEYPDVYTSWFKEGFDEGVEQVRREALASMQASLRERTSSEKVVEAWFDAAFPEGFSEIR